MEISTDTINSQFEFDFKIFILDCKIFIAHKCQTVSNTWILNAPWVIVSPTFQNYASIKNEVVRSKVMSSSNRVQLSVIRIVCPVLSPLDIDWELNNWQRSDQSLNLKLTVKGTEERTRTLFEIFIIYIYSLNFFNETKGNWHNMRWRVV